MNRIVHPVVIAKIKSGIRKSAPRDVVVVDAPLLIEANLAGMADVLVVVKCSKEEQIERCMRKFRMEKRRCFKEDRESDTR